MLLLKIPSKLKIRKSSLCFSVTLLLWLVIVSLNKGTELVQHLILPGIRSERKICDITHRHHKYFSGEFLFPIVKQEISGPFILRMLCHVSQLLTVYETRNSVFRRWLCAKWSYAQLSELDLLSSADNKKDMFACKICNWQTKINNSIYLPLSFFLSLAAIHLSPPSSLY